MNLDKLKIYIASPYSNGWMPDNVRLSLQAHETLMQMGFAPYSPLVSHYQSIMFHHDEHDWLELDLTYLLVCNVMVRIHPVKLNTGEKIPSPGADLEEATAKEHNIPVFHYETLYELEQNFKKDYKKYLRQKEKDNYIWQVMNSTSYD
jgi:hypothetical protein